MKRFYKLVSLNKTPNGYSVQLDGQPVRTPSRQILYAPDEEIAQALMQEWQTQDTHIIPETMPITQFLTTAQDRVAQERTVMQETVLNYLNTDLLCYRAELPHAMAQRQAEAWDQWLAWFKDYYGVSLLTTTDLASLQQPEAAHKAVKRTVEAMDDLSFTILQFITSFSGSLVLGLAFTAGAAGEDAVHKAARVEEDYKAEIYREDFHGLAPHEEKKQDAIRRDLDAARIILTSLQKNR